MKKIFILIMAALLPIMASAQTIESIEINDVWYNLSTSDMTAEVIAHPLNYIGDVVIPKTIIYERAAYRVTSIDEKAFYNCSAVSSVTFPESLKEIGDQAFYNCFGLTSITLPESLTHIGDLAFCGCTDLSFIAIPNNVTFIGSNAFKDCTSLQYNKYSDALYLGNEENPFYAFIKVISTDITSCTINMQCRIIGSSPFSDCNRLTSLVIPKNVTSVGKNILTFQPMADVYCYAEAVPKAESWSFNGLVIKEATLHVPAGSIEQYKASRWGGFGTIVPLDGDNPLLEKCAKPAIYYTNGKLTFNSETEGAECIANISDTDINIHHGNEISLTATYLISVYATKAGYNDSDLATATLCWIDAEPKTEGLAEDAVTEVKAVPVLIQTYGGTISIQGLDNGTQVSVYSTDGMQQGSALVVNGATTINTSLQLGSVAIVKIGEKSVKVLVK